MSDSQARIGVDVGARLTDIVYHDAEAEPIHKMLIMP